ncbi:MAG: 2-succinyl-5-enolpyruvyl-6-hydroxy-3-cyclohexene-1-carboxylic-acid synthase [Bacteroidales bacterium]|nr:2-succinyl-5-enolpyruvyl-6-hydroxy-3-cyclohexene-1-carboxylic-acid synthase [Bacteroidales bacterium]
MPSKRQGVSELPYICEAHGIGHAVISPGSRNAPLILSFVSHSGINCISITDERSAGYYALGMAQQLKKPVALICTSGTALANYTPALTEAFYLKIPLLVLSADRPPEWIDQNDGQTIRQNNFFPNSVKRSFITPTETEKKEDLWYFRRIINEAISISITGSPGPVHVNIPLREPLYEPLPEVTTTPEVMKVLSGNPELRSEQWQEILQKWESFQRKLIVCGFSSERNPELETHLAKMAENNEAVVIAENLSNLSLENFIHSPERFVAAIRDKESFKPDLLVTIGGAVVSKRLKKYLREFSPREHWHVDENEMFVDTYQSLSQNIKIKSEYFFRKIAGSGPVNQDYCQIARQINEQAINNHDHFLSLAEFSDLKAYNMVFMKIPSDCNLHLANSTPVRYAQLFPSRAQTNYFSNRGTSGIDGCVSTAAGAAMVSEKLNILLLGDLAFIYDSNGLWNNNLPANLRIIIIDNGGGNIFKLIETGPEVEKIRPFIETPHKVNLKELCRAFDVEYMSARNSEELENILPEVFKPNRRSVVLHIQTSGEVSAKTFKQYFQYIIKNNEH